MLAVPMILLYELGILFVRWGKPRKRAAEESLPSPREEALPQRTQD
jgi:sec-independent protein translocase protein TatC